MKKRILFIFVDGIGLGEDDTSTNPFIAANLPTLNALTNNQPWIAGIESHATDRAIFIPTDPRMGVEGRPQSGSSQAAIVTGKNVPEIIGRHYGPLPNAPIREILDKTNIFMTVREKGDSAELISAYPPQRLAGINSGKRLPSSIQYAAIAAGQELHTTDAVIAETALTPEYTGFPWQKHLKIREIPTYDAFTAGQKLVEISRSHRFAFHSNWMTDYIGHRGTLEQAVDALETLDGVIAGVLDAWDDDEGLVILTSDHGNMEDMSHGKHTEADVPTMIIGNNKEKFADGFAQLKDFVPRIISFLYDE